MPPKKKRKKNMPKPKKASKKKSAPKKKVKTKKAPPKKKAAKKNRKAKGRSQSVATVAFEPRGLGANSGGQSGDLQGLSSSAEADSESVDELLEEGNAFEAEAVEGVEDAPDADRGGIRTHEVPEDDVPDEYLDKDQ
jgi:hypothetical protein